MGYKYKHSAIVDILHRRDTHFLFVQSSSIAKVCARIKVRNVELKLNLFIDRSVGNKGLLLSKLAYFGILYSSCFKIKNYND